jgi:hypothetical protein
MKDLMDIFTSIVLMCICINYAESKVILLQIDPFEIMALMASLWAVFRFGDRIVRKVNDKMLEQKIKNIK